MAPLAIMTDRHFTVAPGLAILLFYQGKIEEALQEGIDAIEDALGLLEREPFAGKALRGKLRGLYSLRVGAYRILYQVVDEGKTVRVAAIRHRSTSYGNDPR